MNNLLLEFIGAKNYPFFLLLILLMIQLNYSFHWDGNTLYDLETNTLVDFTAETLLWSLSSYATAGVKFSQCGTDYLVGGSGILGGSGGQYFERIYSSLPIHNQIYLQIQITQIDTFDGGTDYFTIDIDSNSINGWNLDYHIGTSDFCGQQVGDYKFTTCLSYAHSASSLTLRIVTRNNEASWNEALGVRDVKIEFLTNPTPYFSICAPDAPPTYLSPSRCSTTCTSPGNAISPTGTGFCFPASCSSSCKSCSGTSTTCTDCATGSFLIGTTCYSACDSPLATKTLGGVIYCETPCPGQYAWWDGSCFPSCSYATSYSSYAIVGATVNTFQECQYPCATNEFLSWNATCLSSCPSPLMTTPYKGRNFCEYPCSSSDFLYWNGSCLSTCDSPLTLEIQGSPQQRKFCWFPCPDTQFLYWNGSCLNTCPSPLAPETQSLSQPRKFCWYPCQSSEHLYWNGSCLSTCPSPLTSEKQGISTQQNFCWYTCSDTQYLYWNGSCLNNCPSPLASEIQGTSSQQRKFCWYPCQPSEFLHWNESCLSTCPSPLSPEIQSVSDPRKFCWYTCAETDFLYWNGSCLNTCPSPLSPETQGSPKTRNFCWFTCQPSEYLYWNQSCSSHCPIPLVRFDLSNNLFCFLPCDMPNIYWYQDLSCRKECNFPFVLLYRDSVYQCLKPCPRPSEHFYDLEKECHDTCDPPYVRQIINTIKVCHIDTITLKSEIDKIKSTADLIEILGKIISTILKAVSVPQLATPRSALLIQLSSLIQYIRYMRINYPWRVQMFFESNGPDLISLNINTNIPNKIEDKLDNYPLPYAFERYSLDSNFINNMWNLLTTVSLILFGIFILLLLKPVFKKNFKATHLITRLLQSLKWNIPIAMVCGVSGEIIFYASLYIRNTPLGSAISIISFLISLLMIFCVFIILCINMKILRGFRLQKQRIAPSPDATPTSETPDWLEKWKGYEILYEEIEQKSLFSLSYMVIYMTRGIISFMILANLYDYPLTQSILINILNILIFIYLLSYKPLKDLWSTVQLIVNEILENILTLCALALAIMDRAEIEARHSRVTLGNVIIITMIIFYILGLVFLVIEGMLFLIEAYKTWKEMRARGIKSPFKMISILLFGEEKTHPEELTEKSSRVDTTTIQTQRDYIQKSDNGEIKGNNLRKISDTPLDSSSGYFLPINRSNLTGIQLSESDIQNTEFEMEISQIKRPMGINNQSQIEQHETLYSGMNYGENMSELNLPANAETPLQSNAGSIQNRRNVKVRMKRFPRSVHRVHWPHDE